MVILRVSSGNHIVYRLPLRFEDIPAELQCKLGDHLGFRVGLECLMG